MIKSLLGMFLLVLVTAAPVMAQDQAPTDMLRARLNALAPNLQPDSIQPSPVEGVYEVTYGAQVLYLSEDGRYLFRGSLIDIARRADLTEAARAGARRRILGKIDKQQMIVFSPEQPRHTITVFTDIDCTYCRKLHSEIGQYLQEGIEVRYLAFPRAGVNSTSYEKAVDVWCAQDRNVALTRAKRDQPVADRSCANPVKAQMKLGHTLGVSGTPAMVLESGEMIPGYQPARALAQTLDQLADKPNMSKAAN
jgi:thiol:disulfide interchange protein DsbC